MGRGPYVNGVEVPELGNYYVCMFVVNGITFNSVEQFFQYSKCVDEQDKQRILECNDPVKCAWLGRKVRLRPDWESAKVDVMRQGVKAKLNAHPHLVVFLLHVDSFWFCENGTKQDEWDKHNQMILTQIKEDYTSSVVT